MSKSYTTEIRLMIKTVLKWHTLLYDFAMDATSIHSIDYLMNGAWFAHLLIILSINHFAKIYNVFLPLLCFCKLSSLHIPFFLFEYNTDDTSIFIFVFFLHGKVKLYIYKFQVRVYCLMYFNFVVVKSKVNKVLKNNFWCDCESFSRISFVFNR